MNLRVILIAVIFGILGIFAALNWSAFMAPTTLSLAFASVQAPLGLILLAIIALLSALFLAFVVYLQGTVIVDSRRQSREMQVQRDLADKAEASRFTELRTAIDAHLQALGTRIEKLDRDFGAALERTEASIAAYVGELDDRMSGGAKESVRALREPGGPA